MYHSLKIGDKETYKDFGLIPTSRPIINPPEVRYTYLEIPGSSGMIDLSESLTGMISYGNRTGSWEFLVPKNRNWADFYSELLTFLHGRFMRVILEDDPHYYYEGRISVNAWKSNKNNSTITLDYTFAPFKYEMQNAIDGFQVITKNLTEGAWTQAADINTKVIETKVECPNTANLNVNARIGDADYACKVGDNILPILRAEGNTSVQVSGNSTVTIWYRKGRL